MFVQGIPFSFSDTLHTPTPPPPPPVAQVLELYFCMPLTNSIRIRMHSEKCGNLSKNEKKNVNSPS